MIFLYFAFVLFVIGTFVYPVQPNTAWYGRFNLLSAGLALLTAYMIWGTHIRP